MPMRTSNGVKDPIVQAGAAVLRQKAKPLSKKDIGSAAVQKLIKRMSAILKKEEYGVALAAPQVGEMLRLFVVAGKIFTPTPEGRGPDQSVGEKVLPDRVFINPEITKRSKSKQEMAEGCLSVRGKYGTVLRHEKVTLKALDQRGAAVTYHGTGLVGHVFQHECDHLEGVLYTDKAKTLRDDDETEDEAKSS